ncbi:MAG: hypothetical protein P1P89_10765 [Desulfobacterales bacterium]|nr:hypothetical protein [Desulfobacterales bacterium]
MSPKVLPEQKISLQTDTRNEVVVLLPAASGRTVGFIVDIGRHGIPFGNAAAAKYTDKENILDTLMDGSFLPFDTGAYSEIEDMEFSDMFYSMENRLRRSLQTKELTSRHLSELEYFMLHTNMTEN